MNDNTRITMIALVPNIRYSDTSDPDIPEHFHWQNRGDTQQMTLAQVKAMFNQRPNYKNWLQPEEQDAMDALGLTDDYCNQLHKLLAKKAKQRIS